MDAATRIRRLAEPPFVRDLPTDGAQAVLAPRFCILCRRTGLNEDGHYNFAVAHPS